jgi:hypothetical protein
MTCSTLFDGSSHGQRQRCATTLSPCLPQTWQVKRSRLGAGIAHPRLMVHMQSNV